MVVADEVVVVAAVASAVVLELAVEVEGAQCAAPVEQAAMVAELLPVAVVLEAVRCMVPVEQGAMVV